VIAVNEIFYSIQGESTYAGLPCVFIRLTGCNLRCAYCDTKYAYDQGNDMTVEQIIDQIQPYPCQLAEITGGEPLLQKETPVLARELIRRGYQVLVETNGSVNIRSLPPDSRRIMDIKCPSSGESSKTDWKNLQYLTENDEVKFVLSDFSDYKWARDLVLKHKLTRTCPVHFSPAAGQMDEKKLAQAILKDGLPVRLNLQLHKMIWPEGTRGV
jgi:7-carboxy-7-deazaguanine synthase